MIDGYIMVKPMVKPTVTGDYGAAFGTPEAFGRRFLAGRMKAQKPMARRRHVVPIIALRLDVGFMGFGGKISWFKWLIYRHLWWIPRDFPCKPILQKPGG